ncbi:MAG TPA: ABC transporter permease subunit [Kribbella sp.]|uniref:ABC transporter permease n=1 Tax=Kribbella sp. TaxID=1871183 RepID=UPI002D78902D|nr:ABC transporter permease subunit [Kribbella sp.]HET6295721.1 ABC transporter permease subunit [Kribbella sp.]
MVVRTIARLTLATLFGHRRGLLLYVLPAVLIGLSLLLTFTVDDKGDLAKAIMQQFGLAVILPLVALIAATGAISSEIDDGSIVYLLSKPINRSTIILTKALVALGVIFGLGVVPIVVSGLVLDPGDVQTALAFGVGALAAGIAYTAIFVALSVMSGNAVTIGLFYSLLWESLMGQYVDGAKVLSIQQWSLALTRQLADVPVDAAVKLPLATLLLLAVTLAGLGLAISRLRSLTLSSAE